MAVSLPAACAISWSSCFLFCALRLGRTACESMISARFMMSSFLVALGGGSARHVEMGVDPPDIAIGAAIDDIEAAVAHIAEEQKRAGRDVELHHGLAHRKFRHIGGTLGDDDGIEILRLGIVLSGAGNDIVGSGAPTHRFDAA